MDKYSDYEIIIPNGKHTGEALTICPQCSGERKKKNLKCLAVNLDKKVWICHHCGWKGGLREEKKPYVKPKWENSTDLAEKVVKYFETRGISQQALTHFKIKYQKEWMPQENKEMDALLFPYFRDGECVNIKYRDGKKGFKMHKDSELIFFNFDCIKDFEEVYIVEGEIDAMTLHQCGFPNVISVPNGANLSSNNMQYIDNCFEQLSKVTMFHLATDNDVAGRRLRADLVERLGVEKCDYVKFKDCKDANDCLVKYGQQGVAESCAEKIDFPIEGVFSINDFKDEVLDYYENGLPKGDMLGMEQFDKLVKFHKGYMAIVTGIPGHGKSSWVDQMVVRLSLKCGWKGAFYSPENRPTKLHISKIIRLVVGKHWEGDYKVSVGEVNSCLDFLDERMFFIKPEKDFTLDSILKSVEMLKKKHGVDVFVIDAWNKLEHKGNGDTNYVGQQLDKIVDFCEKHNVLCFLVAHPTKMKKSTDGLKYEIPTLYDISGSANFYNKADYGMSVYRDFETKRAKVVVQKVKYNHWGETGDVDFEYHFPSGRFYEGSKEGKYQGNWIFENERQEELFEAKPMPRNLNYEDDLFNGNIPLEKPPF